MLVQIASAVVEWMIALIDKYNPKVFKKLKQESLNTCRACRIKHLTRSVEKSISPPFLTCEIVVKQTKLKVTYFANA